MTKATPRYDQQRQKVEPPFVSLRDLRAALGLTLDQVAGRLEEETERPYTRGAISAIENGHRGVSTQLLAALTAAYGLDPGAIKTTYTVKPRESRPSQKAEESAA